MNTAKLPEETSFFLCWNLIDNEFSRTTGLIYLIPIKGWWVGRRDKTRTTVRVESAMNSPRRHFFLCCCSSAGVDLSEFSYQKRLFLSHERKWRIEIKKIQTILLILVLTSRYFSELFCDCTCQLIDCMILGSRSSFLNFGRFLIDSLAIKQSWILKLEGKCVEELEAKMKRG